MMVGLSPDSTITLDNCSILRKLKTSKGSYHNTSAYISDQARLIRTVTSTSLEKIVFMGKWGESQMGRTIDWLEPVKWEMVDRELCTLMDRLDDGVKLEVVFADGVLSCRGEFGRVGCEEAGGEYAMLLKGVRTRGGTVKVQKVEGEPHR